VLLKFGQKIMPETGFLRINEVLKLIPIGRSSWWAGVKTGKYPKPIKLGSKTTVWRVEDIRILIERLGDADAA
jgi:predicted DNA-binding transcriptional regulator AlpA